MISHTNAFTVAVQWFLQREIIYGEITVKMGEAKKARGFDVIHDGPHTTFIIDYDYVLDPQETIEMIEKLTDWVMKCNEIEYRKNPS